MHYRLYVVANSLTRNIANYLYRIYVTLFIITIGKIYKCIKIRNH